jgi:hypothetical protein
VELKQAGKWSCETLCNTQKKLDAIAKVVVGQHVMRILRVMDHVANGGRQGCPL